MNSLRLPGLMSGKQPYREISDEASSDIGSEDHLLGEKSQALRFKRDRERPRFLSVATVLHLACFAFYTALFFVLSVSTQSECADDQTQVWCKSEYS